MNKGYSAIHEAVRWIWTDNYTPIRVDAAIQAARIGSALDVGEHLKRILERIGATVDAEKLADDSQFAKRWWILARAHQTLSRFDYLVIRLAFGRTIFDLIRMVELTHPIRSVYYRTQEAVDAYIFALTSDRKRKTSTSLENLLRLIEELDQVLTEHQVTLPAPERAILLELCSEIQVSHLLR